VRRPKDCVGEQDRIPGSRTIPVEEIEARSTELDDYLERPIAIVTNHAFFLASSSDSLINHAGRHAFSKPPAGRQVSAVTACPRASYAISSVAPRHLSCVTWIETKQRGQHSTRDPVGSRITQVRVVSGCIQPIGGRSSRVRSSAQGVALRCSGEGSLLTHREQFLGELFP
jgi:hypothetical protein